MTTRTKITGISINDQTDPPSVVVNLETYDPENPEFRDEGMAVYSGGLEQFNANMPALNQDQIIAVLRLQANGNLETMVGGYIDQGASVFTIGRELGE